MLTNIMEDTRYPTAKMYFNLSDKNSIMLKVFLFTCLIKLISLIIFLRFYL